jgi:hypothetical protein
MTEQTFTKRADAIAYLTRDGSGSDRAPCSRYGSNGAECAPVAWRVAFLVARESGTWPVTETELNHAMSLVVNDHDDVAHIVNAYGRGDYGRR